jgi:hypothetical protein
MGRVDCHFKFQNRSRDAKAWIIRMSRQALYVHERYAGTLDSTNMYSHRIWMEVVSFG